VEWVSIIIISRGEDNLDNGVGRDYESVLRLVECVGTINDLLKSGNLRRKVRDIVDVPLSLAGCLIVTDSSLREDSKKIIKYVRQRG
jgi:hypothetical protein